MTRRALITGITGQDGSYLAELLLEKGYEVYGIVRRASTFNTGRVDHIYQDPHEAKVTFKLVYADLNDASSLNTVLRTVKPDEIYNLGAQSHVRVSFDIPEYTAEVAALGTLRLLEAIRETGVAPRFYQASSSEMFGKVRETPQKETTPFYPRSSYGCAKVYGYWITVNYRESYGLHASNGILFNHECVTAETPVFVRRHGLIDLLPIEDVVPHRTAPRSGLRYTTDIDEGSAFDVWDARGWTPVTCMTATWNGGTRSLPRKPVHRIAARGAVYQASADHLGFVQRDGKPVEKETGRIERGEELALIDLPRPPEETALTEAEAWLLGLLAADGHVTPEGKVQISNQDRELIGRAAACWKRVTGGSTGEYVAPSGFERGRDVIQLRLLGARAYGRLLREELYTRTGHKRIPRRVLNADRLARLAFLRGFNAGDGLQSTPCTYEFQGFKTASPVLAAGLYWMAVTTLEQRAIICVEAPDSRLYYQINLNSPSVPGDKGQHLRRPLAEVVSAMPVEYAGWLFDLATASGTFHAGIGQGWIHNSPRRGGTFVSRKITRAAAHIKLGLQDTLYLGNLEAKRDWGYAKDYVEAMWLMLQQEQPDDYVVATGETHSVRELLQEAFGYLGMEWERHVKIDPRYFRPAEVDELLGDASKARDKLGWKPRVTFRELVRLMVDADLRALTLPQARPHHEAG